MPRIPSLVWAAPMTLALLVLAKGVVDRSWQTPAGPRVAPNLVERLEPPGRLHAPIDAQPMVSERKGPLPVRPASTDEFMAMSPPVEKRIQVRDATPAAPQPQRQPPILYPIVEDRDVPLLAEAFAGIEPIGAPPERLPAGAKPQAAAGSTFSAAPSSPAGDQALAAARQQMAAMNQRAVKLAQRGALYSARAELLEALRLLAQTHDAHSGTMQRTGALAAALTAMDESDDFTPTKAGAAVSAGDVIRAHQTPVLKRLDASRLAPVTCSQHYYAYAQQQLAQAIGEQTAAASTLSLLGMVHGHLAGQSAGGKAAHTARAIVFHQATLALEPGHYRSANELGVLWARCGELSAARQVLLTSLQSHPTPSAWHNLAAVHERLGERDLAQLARKEAQLLTPKTPQEAGMPTVEWVDAATFAAKGPNAEAPAAARTVQVSAASHTSPSNQAVRR